MKTAGTLFVFALLISLASIPGGRVQAQDKADPKAKEKEKNKAELVDYEKLLNDKLGKGVKSETNAVVLLLKALGPMPEGGEQGMPAEFFKRLGIEEPAREGDYFIGLTSYLKKNTKLDDEAQSAIWEQLEQARKRPWAEKDYPHLAAWLKANEKPLALVIEACQRPDYYHPLISRRADNSLGSLIGTLLPAVQKCRELGLALTTRAMLSISRGNPEAAWRDLLTCHRLARQIARGGTLIEFLVGAAIDAIAATTDLVFLESAGLKSRAILACLKDLQALPAMPPIADKIDVMERLTYLQTLQFLRSNANKLPGIVDDLPTELTPEERKIWESMEWEPAIKSAEAWYDRVVAAMRLKDRAAREKELEKLEKEIETTTRESQQKGYLQKLLNAKDQPKTAVPKAISQVLIGLLMPAFHKVMASQDRSQQIERNLQVAFALAAYKSDEGHYPARLADLSPKYLAAVPDDLFSGKPLIYKPTKEGYRFYSVGPNGKDDGGRGPADTPPGDDYGVEMPLPSPKK